MAKTYGSGLIGLDVKPRRKFKFRGNRFVRRDTKRWVVPALLAVMLIGLLIIAGVR
jgi:hypothetical protein